MILTETPVIPQQSLLRPPWSCLQWNQWSLRGFRPWLSAEWSWCPCWCRCRRRLAWQVLAGCAGWKRCAASQARDGHVYSAGSSVYDAQRKIKMKVVFNLLGSLHWLCLRKTRKSLYR